MAETLHLTDLGEVLAGFAACDRHDERERAMAERLRVGLAHVQRSRARAGRPIQRSQKEVVVDAIAAGITLRGAAELAGVANSTVYREMQRDATFAEAIENAREFACDVAEERLVEVAMDGAADSMATVRACEAVLRRRSARYR